MTKIKVSNAIILAAGGLSISHDTMYAPPKGLLKVDGVPVVERQIQQLHEVGIYDISIVVGYKKEMYIYLEEKYGVTLVGNPRLDKNNIYSLYLVRDKLKDTYICPCDYYYNENPFSEYESIPYHAVSFQENAKSKFVVDINSKNRIINIVAGSDNGGYCIHGLAFFDSQFSTEFVKLMERNIDKYRISSLFWEEFYAMHINEIDLYAKFFNSTSVREFDTLSDLKTLDVLFVNSVSSQIVDNICNELNCTRKDIQSVDILDAGHSNITFRIDVRDQSYVYRYPGVSGKNIVSRKKECFANKIAKELSLDNTLIYINEDGHKISKYIENIKPLNKNNDNELETLARYVKKLHDYDLSNVSKEDYVFNPITGADRLLNMACSCKDNLFSIFESMRQDVLDIYDAIKGDDFQQALCHCNLNSNNCLVYDGGFELIDWEFSGYCDVAYDFPFLGNYVFDVEDLKKYLNYYYGQAPTKDQYRHWLFYRPIHYWFYLCWALYKESVNEDCGNLVLIFYNACKKSLDEVKKYKEDEER